MGHTASQGYDAVGNIETQTDGRGNVTTFAYNSQNRLTSATSPGGAVTSYA
jgi:YD repeat-containing protein